MSGYALSQPYGFAGLTQTTVLPGTSGYPAAPAAGATYTITNTNFDRWRLVFCRFTFTTSAVVADRYVTIEYADGTGKSVASDGAAVAVQASTTAQPFAGDINRGVAEWNNLSDVFFPLCGIWREAGTTIQIAVVNIDVADQLKDIRLTFDVWPGGGNVPEDSDAGQAFRE